MSLSQGCCKTSLSGTVNSRNWWPRIWRLEPKPPVPGRQVLFPPLPHHLCGCQVTERPHDLLCAHILVTSLFPGLNTITLGVNMNWENEKQALSLSHPTKRCSTLSLSIPDRQGLGGLCGRINHGNAPGMLWKGTWSFMTF